MVASGHPDFFFGKENLVGKFKGCFPTSVDDMPRKPFGVDYCVLLWGIGTEHLLARNHQMPNNIVDSWLIEPLGILFVLLKLPFCFLRFYIVGFSTLFPGLLFSLFPK